MPKLRNIGTCSVEGCDKPERSVNLCANHYALYRKRGSTDKLIRTKRSNPLYNIWFERKSRCALCSEWENFWIFIKDVGERPSKDHYLARIRQGEVYSPTNFKWQEHLKRRPGESRKEWHARKWATRQLNNPGAERTRELQRKFGITIEDYNRMLESQNGVCAICKKPESSFDAKTGGIKRLAIDHCHVTKRIRELLCFRCNTTIGRLEDSIELFTAMRTYLEKHKPV